MAYKPIDSRQVINRAALANIGSPAGDSLDDILNLINAALSGASGASGYIAKQISLTIGSSSVAVTIPVQPDTSYVVYATLENLTDPTPQFQQPLVANKTTTGFTLLVNTPLDSSNYILSYVVPYKVFAEGETQASPGSASVATTLSIPRGSATYGMISSLENYNDTNPQFQTSVVTTKTTSGFTSSLNVPTDSGNYVDSYTINATGSVAIGSGVNSISVVLPINYNTANYGIVAVMENLIDSNPKFQPLLVTSRSGAGFTVSFNSPTDSSDYVLYYYVISLTP